MAPHSSTFAWKIPWTEEPGRLQSVGSLESDTSEWLHFHFSLSCIEEGNGNPIQCSCLENPRDREPTGLPSMGLHRVRHDWSDLAAAAFPYLCLCFCSSLLFCIRTCYIECGVHLTPVWAIWNYLWLQRPYFQIRPNSEKKWGLTWILARHNSTHNISLQNFVTYFVFLCQTSISVWPCGPFKLNGFKHIL